jgi:SSS family solute:Na+ symporter
LAGLALIPVAFLPTSVVLGALKANIISDGINGKDAIPLVLSTLGNKMSPGGGIILVIGLVLVAVNSGSGLNRALIRSFQEAPFIPKSYRQSAALASWANSLFAFGLALTGLTIVHLMVSFYAIYVAGVFVPFMAYLLERGRGVHFSANAVRWAAWTGSGSAALVFIVLAPISDTPDTWMILTGMSISAFILWALRSSPSN